uniref:Ig-like domain-containing protein n=1 Tax=Loxodonta africana TaxID=9785 RepID=G3UGV2_LOXAF
MSWASSLFMLLTLCTGCGPQPVLHQPPSVSSSLGTMVTLPCTLSKDYIDWYQQRLGQAPRFLLRFFFPSDEKQGPRPPHLSVTKDVASNTEYLSISKLQAEDEAVLLC